MPTSRSGPIRQTVGPVRTRLLGYIDLATKLYIGTSVGELNKEDCLKFADDVRELAAKIKISISTVDERDKQWQGLLLSLDDEARADEEALYTDVALDPRKGYLPVVERCQELLCTLDRKGVEADRRVASITTAPAELAAAGPPFADDRRTAIAKLPKLTLPTFGGEHLQWHNFWDIFKVNVHDQKMGGAEKFAYLRGQLSGSALHAIDGLGINDANYITAVEILRDRFQLSSSQLVSALYGQLRRLTSAAASVKSLTETYDSLEKIFRQLENAGECVDDNRSLVLDVLSKYPSDVVKELMKRYQVSNDSSIKDIRTATRKYIKQSGDIADMLGELRPFDDSKAGRGKSSVSGCESGEGGHGTHTTSAFTTTATRETSSTSSKKLGGAPGRTAQSFPGRGSSTVPGPCYFCSGQHLNVNCTRYTTLEQRWNRLRESNRCFRCLRPDHHQSRCIMLQQSLRCYFCKAVGHHPPTLCPQQFGPKDVAQARPASEEPTAARSSALLSSKPTGYLMTATTTITNPDTKASATVRVLFDTGSHESFITAACAKSLKLQSLDENVIHVSIFGSTRTLTVTSQMVSVGMRQRDGSTRFLKVNTVPLITDCQISTKGLPAADLTCLRSMPLDLADNYDGTSRTIDFMVGLDYYNEFIVGLPMMITSGIYVTPSTVGLLVSGRPSDDATGEKATLLCLTETFGRTPLDGGLPATTTAKLPPYPDVDEYWSLEKIGIHDDPLVRDDDKALDQFNETVVYEGGRYHVKWPWKTNSANLPTNEELAAGRCVSLRKRLDSISPEVREKYEEVISDQIKKGVIERVPEDEVSTKDRSHLIHYLPHHPVVKPSSTTTKVRIVYDASSKTRKDNPSLNECLYRGPVMLPDLCAMLIRFRVHAVALVADVEKAFLQIGLQMPDRDVTRFLWFDRDGRLIHFRFRRVPFGVISSPFLLGAVIQYHLRRDGTWVALLIAPNIYVDNVICGVEDDHRATEVTTQAKIIFQQAGMNLQEWCSNSEEVMATIPEGDRAKSRDIKLLGLQWDSVEDTFRLRNNWNPSSSRERGTKREILQAIASVYDPLGLFQPVLLRAKVLVQHLWEQGKSWDEEIGDELRQEWRVIYDDILPIFCERIPRRPSGLDMSGDVTLVVFSDASQAAYAACAYLRSWDSRQKAWSVTLVYAKSRLAPKAKTPVSMPRLELLGVTIAAKMAAFVREALQRTVTPTVFLFTDSMCVFHWLRTAKPLSVFVANRVREINSLAESEVMYVRTSDNPADINTRGMSAAELRSSELWWRGPAWLRKSHSTWPVPAELHVSESSPSPDMLAECKKQPMETVTLLAGEGPPAERVPEAVGGERPLGIDPTSYSSFRKLQHVTAWCLRYLRLRVWGALSDRVRLDVDARVRGMFDVDGNGPLTVAELTQAKRVWVCYDQREHFGELSRALTLGKKHILIKQLGVNFDDQGMLRCYGRFDHADLSAEAIRPKLLSRKGCVTQLIIRELHERMFHTGVGHTLSQLRREYWVPGGRNAVRSVVSRCVVCRKCRGAPFGLPMMPPWPRERVSRSRAFAFTGLDYFGPVNVKVLDTTQKMWVCLFTCLAVRAVHLEWVGDCSAKEFLDCLVRFVSRRGTPVQIISDNAPQFRVTKAVVDKIWARVFEDDSVQSYASSKSIVWKFTTELAPWQGGFYERLVGIVKGSFRAAIGRRMLPFGEFLTLCTEVEAVANSRPITHVYGDLHSGPPLRPVDFLTDLATGIPESDRLMSLDGLGEAGRNLIRYWKLKQGRLDSLWKFWYQEYLLSLRERGQAHHRPRKGEIDGTPVVNQVVLVKDTEAPRGTWKVAKVVRIIPSGDGSVRSAEVLLPNRMTIRRAINHLYPLEIQTVANDTAVIPTGVLPGAGGVDQPVDETDFDGFTEAEVEDAERRVEDYQQAAGRDVFHRAVAANLVGVAFGVTL